MSTEPDGHPHAWCRLCQGPRPADPALASSAGRRRRAPLVVATHLADVPADAVRLCPRCDGGAFTVSTTP